MLFRYPIRNSIRLSRIKGKGQRFAFLFVRVFANAGATHSGWVKSNVFVFAVIGLGRSTILRIHEPVLSALLVVFFVLPPGEFPVARLWLTFGWDGHLLEQTRLSVMIVECECNGLSCQRAFVFAPVSDASRFFCAGENGDHFCPSAQPQLDMPRFWARMVSDG